MVGLFQIPMSDYERNASWLMIKLPIAFMMYFAIESPL